MRYCDECGHALIEKNNGIDGKIPYCPQCQKFKFPMFNSAISAIIFNSQKDHILLIQQYQHKDYILVAGYINKGENAKEALLREIDEEVHLKVKEYVYNDNEYYQPTNTLMHNYAVVVDSMDFQLTNEVDTAKWIPVKDVLKVIKQDSLAQSFVKRYLEKRDYYAKDIFL